MEEAKGKRSKEGKGRIGWSEEGWGRRGKREGEGNGKEEERGSRKELRGWIEWIDKKGGEGRGKEKG